MVICHMLKQDTICAVSTPPGEGGIGIIRMSGPDAIPIAAKIFIPGSGDISEIGSHRIRYGRIIDPYTKEVIDEALASIMRAPATYTREDVVEINCHGGMMPLKRTMELLVSMGARPAEPGEFTKRAFLNGRIDLAQAEAVMDIIRARTEESLKAAAEQLSGRLSEEVRSLREAVLGLLSAVEAGIDFPEEDIETPSGRGLVQEISGIMERMDRLINGFIQGRILREGFKTAIVGRPNVGKSSLLNALLMQERAIVTDVPGTTRDIIEEFVNIKGVPLRIIDTAGIRETHDMVEQEGVKRSLAAIGDADLVLVVLDGSEPLHQADRRVLEEIRGRQAAVVINKSDLPRRLEWFKGPEPRIEVSAKSGAGMDRLRDAISDIIGRGMVSSSGHAWAVNQRHKRALEEARRSLMKAKEAAAAGLSPEFIAVDLKDALDAVGTIIGATYTEDILDRIFSSFCIGK